MALKTIEGSAAIAEVVKNCDPDVVACYPITPSTHIAEDLNKFYADGELKSFIPVESEFSAISVLIGGSAAGARTFTTTSSQGLALMHEALFNAAGMRLPIVMCVVNRALSAPLNIWNDIQDSMSQRDSGWIQIYCESNQEAVDSIVQAYRIAERTLIPVMVCVDGFYLTHAVEQIDVPDNELIAKYLPKFNPKYKLDPKNPLSFGVYALPKDYQGFREDLEKDIVSAKEEIMKAENEWEDLTGRSYGNGLWEEYRCSDALYLLVTMGSVAGNAKVAVDEMRKEGKNVGLLRIRSYRPFPTEIYRALDGKRAIGVFEKDISLGGSAPLFSDVLNAVCALSYKPALSSFVGGLGGKDVSVEDCKKMFEKLMRGERVRAFI